MVDWKFGNKLRPHNRKETLKHFIVKAMVFKVLFCAGHIVYSEYDMWGTNEDGERGPCKVADVCTHNGKIVVEVESKPTKKHIESLVRYYKDKDLYIIDVRKISNNINKMEKKIKHILGI